MADLSLALAESNLEAQERGLAAIRNFGRSIETIANLMQIQSDLVEAILNNSYDITLSDLQELCLAANVSLTFNVEVADS